MVITGGCVAVSVGGGGDRGAPGRGGAWAADPEDAGLPVAGPLLRRAVPEHGELHEVLRVSGQAGPAGEGQGGGAAHEGAQRQHQQVAFPETPRHEARWRSGPFLPVSVWVSIRKPDYLEETYADTGRTCKLHTERPRWKAPGPSCCFLPKTLVTSHSPNMRVWLIRV